MDIKRNKIKLIHAIGILIFHLAVTLSCTNKPQTENIEFSYVQEIEFDSAVNQVIIKNPTDSLINIQLYLNDKFWYSKEDILSAVEKIETDSLPGLPVDAAKAMAFVMQNTFHYQEIHLDKIYAYQPLYLLNSWGGALCSHRNSALAQIWKWQGYEARCIQLNAHVVPEIFYDENWMMLDADYNTWFLTETGQITDFTILGNRIETFEMQTNPEIASLMCALSRFEPEGYYQHYKGDHENRIEPWFIEDIPEIELYLSVPVKATIRIPSDKHPQYGHYQLGEMHIPNYYSGSIITPFAIFSCQCDTIYHENFQFVQNQINPPGNYFIEGENIRIEFLINPVIFADPVQSLRIKKDKSTKLSIETAHDPLTDISAIHLREALLRIQKIYAQNPPIVNDFTKPELFQIQSNADFTACFNEIMQIDSSTMPDSINTKLTHFFDLLEQNGLENKFRNKLKGKPNNCIKVSYLIYFLPVEYYDAALRLL